MSGSTGGFSWPSRRPASIAGRSALRDCLGRRMSSSTYGSGGAGEWLSALPALPPETAPSLGCLERHVEHGVASARADRDGRVGRRRHRGSCRAPGRRSRQLHRLFRQHLGAARHLLSRRRGGFCSPSSLFTRPRCACRKSPWRRALAAFGGLTRHPPNLPTTTRHSASRQWCQRVARRGGDRPAAISSAQRLAGDDRIPACAGDSWRRDRFRRSLRPHHRYRRCPRCRPRSPRAGKCLGSECARREAVRAAVDHRPAPARIRPRGGPGDHRSTPIGRSPAGSPGRSTAGAARPGAWDGFELAVRAMLGQQITVAGAINLAGRLVSRYGERLKTTVPALAGLTHVFRARGPCGGRPVDRRNAQGSGRRSFRRSLRPLRSIPRSSALDARLRRPSSAQKAGWHRRVDGAVHRDAGAPSRTRSGRR